MNAQEKKIIIDFVKMNQSLYDKAVEENDTEKIITMWAALFSAQDLAERLGVKEA